MLLLRQFLSELDNTWTQCSPIWCFYMVLRDSRSGFWCILKLKKKQIWWWWIWYFYHLLEEARPLASLWLCSFCPPPTAIPFPSVFSYPLVSAVSPSPLKSSQEIWGSPNSFSCIFRLKLAHLFHIGNFYCSLPFGCVQWRRNKIPVWRL